MIAKQPKLLTESDLQVIFRNTWLVVLVAFHGLACYFFPLFLGMAKSGNPLTISVCSALFGVIGSQFVILGFLFAMFPAGPMMRLSLVIGLVAVSICVIVFGNHHFAGVLTVWLEIYLSWLPILLAGWSIPFFAAKAFFGWSLRFQHDHSSEEPKLTVSSLLIGTALIACCLTLLKTGSAVRVAPAIAASIACMGCGFVFAIPITLMMLTEHRFHLKIIKGLVISIGPAATLLGAWGVSGTADWKPLFGVIAMSSMLMSYCTFLIGIRMLGLRFSMTTRHPGF